MDQDSNQQNLAEEVPSKRKIMPDDLNTPIWRYLDFSKFMDILENSTLFFSSIKGFEDKFEGFNNAFADNLYYELHLDENGNNKLIRTTVRPVDDEILKGSNDVKRYVMQNEAIWHNSIGINCWRIDEVESHAMWKVYLKSDEGVAIKSSVSLIKESISLTDLQRLDISKIEYVDFNNYIIDITKNPLTSIYYKSKYFEHEKELRLVYYEKLPSNQALNFKLLTTPGYNVSVNINILINEVIVSPYAPNWFFNLVKKITQKYIPLVPVTVSGIQLR